MSGDVDDDVRLDMPDWGSVPPVEEPPAPSTGPPESGPESGDGARRRSADGAGRKPPDLTGREGVGGSGRVSAEQVVRQAVLDVARTQVGKHYGVGNVTPYGTWYGSGWRNALFCAAGWSWCWYQALGEETARSLIGSQVHGGAAPHGRGFVWTVAIIEQHRSRKVPLKHLRPGDALLFKYRSGDPRAKNEVNHVDLVEKNNPKAGYVDVIGFNVAKPGAPPGSDPGKGGGVWRRRIPYTYPFIVAGLQMPATPPSKDWPTIQKHLTTLGLAELKGSGVVGPATRTGIAAYARDYGYTGAHDDSAALLTHLEETMANITEELAALRGEVKALRDVVDKQSGDLSTVRDSVSREAVAAAVWAHKVDGHGPFNAWWWLRRGLVLNPEHKQYPADPDSPADVERQAAQTILGRELQPCTGVRREHTGDES